MNLSPDNAIWILNFQVLGNVGDVKRLVEKGVQSDSFARHFGQHYTKGDKPSNPELRKKMKYQILWQGDPISCMKTFGKLNCSLCMRERIEILKAQQLPSSHLLINSNNEIFGACRHKTKFHRFLRETTNVKSTSTDEGIKPERVNNGGVDKAIKKPAQRARSMRDIIPPPGDPQFCAPIEPTRQPVVVYDIE